MRDKRTTNDEQLKIDLLSQWKLEAESRNLLLIELEAQSPSLCGQEEYLHLHVPKA